MAPGNGSFVTEFILVGLTDLPGLQFPLFCLFLVMYMVTVLGNLGLITLLGLNSHLHTPMYFFLFNLSFIDLCYASVFTPKMLTNFISMKNIISYRGCITQLYFFCFFVISECYVLTSMAYDRYVAICNPLLYNVVMSPRVCSSLMLGSYLMAFSGAMAHTGCMLRLTFYPLRERMAPGNSSFVAAFILVGLTDLPDLQLPLFCLFLVMYVVTVLGNLGLITLIGLNSHLHTPMYFFLFNLSCIDFCYASVFTPKMLTHFVSKKNMISYMGCMTQLYFFCFFAISECYVLTSMAYDRYVAIYNPLLYNVVMSPRVCSSLMLGSYLMAFSGAMAHTGCMLRLTFCDANTINHYFCDILPLLQLSCTSTYVNELVVFIVGGINVIVPSVTIFVSYGFILSSILRISSTEGRSKAFNTCSSHI
ncbi:OR8B3 protein, partial [Crocuta crocuta]